MVRVKVFCMQKDEEDILEEWILYHASLFGLSNLYVVDNHSKPASKSILTKYQQRGLNVSEQPDYRHKGDYLFQLIKEQQDQCDWAIPLDVDEFIAVVDEHNVKIDFIQDLATQCQSFQAGFYLSHYPQVQETGKVTPVQALEHFMKIGYRLKWSPCPEGTRTEVSISPSAFLQQHRDLILKYYPEQTLSCHRDQILTHLEQLPKYGRYSFLYYLTSRNGEMDYLHPIEEITQFDRVDYENYDGKGNYNKKFFDPRKLTFLDHGHHHGRVDGLSQNQYQNSQLVLFHYHHRGVRKLIEKCRNDILGLGYVTDLTNQRELRKKIAENVRGAHNMETYLTYLVSGVGALLVLDDDGIQLPQMSQRIRELKS